MTQTNYEPLQRTPDDPLSDIRDPAQRHYAARLAAIERTLREELRDARRAHTGKVSAIHHQYKAAIISGPGNLADALRAAEAKRDAALQCASDHYAQAKRTIWSRRNKACSDATRELRRALSERGAAPAPEASP